MIVGHTLFVSCISGITEFYCLMSSVLRIIIFTYCVSFIVIIISVMRVNLVSVPDIKQKSFLFRFVLGGLHCQKSFFLWILWEIPAVLDYIFITSDPGEKLSTPFLVSEVKVSRLIELEWHASVKWLTWSNNHCGLGNGMFCLGQLVCLSTLRPGCNQQYQLHGPRARQKCLIGR